MDKILVSRSCPSPDTIISHLLETTRADPQLASFGSFSVSIYDTAWVSMVHTVDNGLVEWLFPRCFKYLLSCQQSDGSWPAYTSPVDGILNTSAALLALLHRHQILNGTDAAKTSLLADRINRACVGLQKLLSSWDVDSTDHVAFEIIVPSMLKYIQEFGRVFKFRGRKSLMRLCNGKMKKFASEIVYSKRKTTILHSLEALQGLIDFDRVAHHCTAEAGICGSPSSTAAYLINSSSWDHRAVAYLTKVNKSYAGYGGVPSAFPTGIFELSWALSTLCSSQSTAKLFQTYDLQHVTAFFDKTFRSQKGLVGFTPGVVEDADDTARTAILLYRAGYEVDVEPMVKSFQSTKHFRTYVTERNPSFSANCNVLLALLESKSMEQHHPQIQNTVGFLLDSWSTGTIVDKWNLSPDYSHMLLCETLVSLLQQYDSGHLPQLSQSTVLQQVPITLCQILSHALKGQKSDGGWSDSLEITAYNILILAKCLSLPWAPTLRNHVIDCLRRGQEFIGSEYGNPAKDSLLWIEKTTYQPRFLKAVYCSSAFHVEHGQATWSSKLTERFSSPAQNFEKMASRMLSTLPLFRQRPIRCMDLVLTESQLFSARLQDNRCLIIPRDEIPMTKDKYLQFLPLIWVACNHIAERNLATDVMWDMILLSLQNYQMDEYMESVIARLDEISLNQLISTIKLTCNRMACDSVSPTNNSDENEEQPKENLPDRDNIGRTIKPDLPTSFSRRVIQIVTNFIEHILSHPKITCSSALTRRNLAFQLQTFLLAHIDHNAANARLRYPSSGPPMLEPDYHTWIRTTGSADTSCPFSFTFFTCLVSPSAACPEAGYVLHSLASHLAAMCRQYNDLGSAARDADERNLNSLDFAEFASTSSTVADHGRASKTALMDIAEFERGCVRLCLDTLERRALVDAKTLGAIKVFVDVTDLFGQVYVARDIASRVVKEE